MYWTLHSDELTTEDEASFGARRVPASAAIMRRALCVPMTKLGAVHNAGSRWSGEDVRGYRGDLEPGPLITEHCLRFR